MANAHYAKGKEKILSAAVNYLTDRSERAETEFTKYFGPRQDVDARRDTRTDQVHHNHAIF